MSCDGASLQISDSKDHFVKDGKPFFYLADTAWLAFANATIDDWAEYLDYRKIQGFNALQMIVLPIPHDTSESAIGILPFKTDNTGKMDFHAINDQYFDRAQTMLELATERGFLPVLAPLWCNYVEGSWASHSFEDKVMPLSAVKPYMEYVVDVVRATREDAALLFGASPRAANMLAVAIRALAVVSGREFVIPDDVKTLAGPLLAHRVVLSPDAEIEGLTRDMVVKRILEGVPAPR